VQRPDDPNEAAHVPETEGVARECRFIPLTLPLLAREAMLKRGLGAGFSARRDRTVRTAFPARRKTIPSLT
jgi:hypothetical protein